MRTMNRIKEINNYERGSTRTGGIILFAGLTLAAIGLIGYIGMNSITTELETKVEYAGSQPRVVQTAPSISAEPVSVASNCYGHVGSVCNISVWLEGDNISGPYSTSSNRMGEITSLDAAIQKEIVDGDNDPIQLYFSDNGSIDSFVVEDLVYHPYGK